MKPRHPEEDRLHGLAGQPGSEEAEDGPAASRRSASETN